MSILPLLLTGSSALLNLFSSLGKKAEEKDKISRYLQTLDKAKITPAESMDKQNAIDRLFNSESADALNTVLLDYGLTDARNISNLRSKLSSKLLGEKVKAKTDLDMKITDYNKKIDLNKAQGELAMPSYNLGSAISDLGMGAISGYQLSQTIELLNKFAGDSNTTGNNTEENNQGNKPLSLFDTTLRLNGMTNDLTNFDPDEFIESLKLRLKSYMRKGWKNL